MLTGPHNSVGKALCLLKSSEVQGCVCVRVWFVNILCGGGPFWRVNRWWRALRPFLKAGNARQIKLHEHTHTH